jgi:acetoacetate decarboxylase
MAYKFEAKPYFQPAHFGPWPIEPVLHYGDLTSMFISYITDKDAVASMLPPGFEPSDVPTVSVWAQYCQEVSFLAGFGYNIVGVNFGAVWNGKKETRTGAFSAVLWENDFYPIMYGREHLGAPKLWGDIPDVQVNKDGDAGGRVCFRHEAGARRNLENDGCQFQSRQLVLLEIYFTCQPEESRFKSAHITA